MVTKTRDAFYDSDAVSNETAYVEKLPSLTVQADANETDINVIVARYGIGHPPPQNVRAPMYGDFTGISDYRSAIEALDLAQDSFMQMDASVRARFENNPALFVDFCSNKDNLEEMRRLGLAVPAPAVPAPVPAAAPAPAAPTT